MSLISGSSRLISADLGGSRLISADLGGSRLQDPLSMSRLREDRMKFGRFFFRFPNGPSVSVTHGPARTTGHAEHTRGICVRSQGKASPQTEMQ